MEKLKQTKQLKAMIHILTPTPQGVSEKSINKAAHSMSVRNVPTELQRHHDIRLINTRVRLRAKDGSLYRIYQLLDIKQVNKLSACLLLINLKTDIIAMNYLRLRLLC